MIGIPTWTRRLVSGWVGVSVLSGIVAGLGFALHVHVNTSPSLPLGLYREVAAPLARGATVLACLPERLGTLAKRRGYLGPGRCPAGIVPIGKIIVAMPGDTVTFAAAGLTINRWSAPHSAPRSRDQIGRALTPYPFGTFVVPEGHVILYAPHRLSFDSRYYGPLPAVQIQAVIRPLWIAASNDGG